jgi:ribulose-5-phosphate 4-epimerase/fuculose-1-phosphate aldolase
MNNYIEQFIKMSRYAGMREDLVQAGGGNTSVKLDSKTMLVKSSGYQLAELAPNYGYSSINYPEIVEAFNSCKNLDLLTDDDAKRILSTTLIDGGRPSIETFLHAITRKFTMHTHPIVVNILLACKDAKSVVEKLFPEAYFVAYATPGVELAKEYFRSMKEHISDKNQIVFMQNHGLVVSAEDLETVLKLNEEVIGRVEEYLGVDEDMAPYHVVSDLWRLFPEKIVWRITDMNVMSVYKKQGLWKHVFCPDCVVFLNKQMWAPDALTKDSLDDFKAQYGAPVVISWKENLYVVAASVKKAMEMQSVLSFSAQVMAHVPESKCNFLSNSEQNYLLHWDAEKYRQNIK